MEPLLVLALLVSFILTLFFIPIWIKKVKNAGLVGKDINKYNKREVAEGGGVPVLLGFIFGVLVYVAIKTFRFHTQTEILTTFGLLISVLIISFVGLMDDLLGWKIGLTKKTRLLFLIFAAVPLMVINAGSDTMMGINFGILYPLFLIPLGVVGVSATYNFLAGYNGLEAGQGIIILAALAFVNWRVGNGWLAVVNLCMVSSLVAFYTFNKYPAKIFPGDVLTYSVGALIAMNAILGNIEKITIFFYIPYIIEVALKSRGKLRKESFSKPNKDGSLEMPYDKIYGLEHLAIYVLKKIKTSKKVYERDVVWLINGFQILIVIIGILFVL